jgi:hypothetical protein
MFELKKRKKRELKLSANSKKKKGKNTRLSLSLSRLGFGRLPQRLISKHVHRALWIRFS